MFSMSSILTGGRRRLASSMVVSVVAVAGIVMAGCGALEEFNADPATVGTNGDGTDGDGTDGGADVGVDEGQAGGQSVELVRLSDGDSGVILVDGEEVEFRLLGYNAPERFEGDDGPLSCNGAAAGAALEAAITDAEPGADLSFVAFETDRFGRTLGDFVIDGTSVVEDLVAQGWGLAIGETGRRDLMAGAAAAGLGLWGSGCGAPAADGIVVDRVEPDPPGRDEENLNGEVVELINEGSATIDLAGWDIRDDSSSHRFDLEGTLEPGRRLIVRTGSGTSNRGELFLGSPTPVWSNRGDTVLVIDPEGVVAAWAFVDG